MFDTMNFIWIVLFCFSTGFVLVKIIGNWKRKSGKIKQIRKEPEGKYPHKDITQEEYENLDPMLLRNGMNVTRDEHPTFAEQWVNIMNYNGENQKEEDYGARED